MKRMKTIFGLTLVSLLTSQLAFAQKVVHQDTKNGYSIKVIHKNDGEGLAPTPVPEGAAGFLPDGQTLNQTSAKLGTILTIGEQIVAIGELVYDIIDRGKPVTNINHAPISVLPRVGDSEDLAHAFHQMEGWKLPKVAEYEIVFTNGFGMDVVRYEVNLVFVYGGSYQGKGQYLTGVQVVPSKVEVAWGFRLNSHFKLATIANMGSKEDPIAMANINLEYSVRPVIPLKNIDDTINFTVTGDGQFRVY